tara:strand:+ start:2034 stop:2915 length:882 start_codon:yes stop_codon:yes gene_type:complete
MKKTASEIQAKSDRIGQSLRGLLPNFLRSGIKKVFFGILDFKYYLSGGSKSMVPPPSTHFIGKENYLGIGKEFFDYFVELGGVKQNDTVLDIGCGTGRMAVSFTDYLSETGQYFGFDIMKDQVEWAQNNISDKYDNFHFQHVEVVNPIYNKDGIDADKYNFPFNDSYFDFIFLTSVFTHMLPNDLNNYLSEIQRVLKDDGRCFATFFLLNPESSKLIEDKKSTMNFIHQVETETCLTTDKDAPEEAIAYDEKTMISYIRENRLSVINPIHYGSWCGRSNYLSFQDIIIIGKED